MILEPKEKIVLLRKKYEISQKELAGTSFTPANLSYIEKGKIKLSEKKAKIIADNFNDIFKRKENIFCLNYWFGIIFQKFFNPV